MKRKLVKQGAATMMISLPSKWIKENNLDKGDEINLYEKGKELIITSNLNDKEKKELSIDITQDNKQDIKNILTHAYRKGINKIILKGNNKGLLKEINFIVTNLLLGFEVTETASDKIILENLSEPSGAKYDVILKKIFQIIEGTQKRIIEDFETGKFNNLDEQKEFLNQQDRFILFCRRLLSKGLTGKDSILEWELLTFLMHIQHRYFALYEYASRSKIIKDKDIISLLNSLKEYFSLFNKSYWNKDIKSIHKINDLKKEYYLGKCLNALEKSKGKNTIILVYIREIFRIIQIGTSPILAELLE